MKNIDIIHVNWEPDFPILYTKDIVCLCLRRENFELEVIQVVNFLHNR